MMMVHVVMVRHLNSWWATGDIWGWIVDGRRNIDHWRCRINRRRKKAWNADPDPDADAAVRSGQRRLLQGEYR